MVGGFAAALWAAGTAPHVDSVLYREYMHLRQKSEDQQKHSAQVNEILEKQNALLSEAMSGLKEIASSSTKSAQCRLMQSRLRVRFAKLLPMATSTQTRLPRPFGRRRRTEPMTRHDVANDDCKKLALASTA